VLGGAEYGLETVADCPKSQDRGGAAPLAVLLASQRLPSSQIRTPPSPHPHLTCTSPLLRHSGHQVTARRPISYSPRCRAAHLPYHRRHILAIFVPVLFAHVDGLYSPVLCRVVVNLLTRRICCVIWTCAFRIQFGYLPDNIRSIHETTCTSTPLPLSLSPS
jgi:hypothetical protein